MGNEDSEPEDGVIHDEVEIEDFEYDPTTETFTYPCPCGDEFTVSKDNLAKGGKYAKCPSCSLMVQVILNIDDLESIVETKSAQKKTTKSSVTAGVKTVTHLDMNCGRQFSSLVYYFM